MPGEVEGVSSRGVSREKGGPIFGTCSSIVKVMYLALVKSLVQKSHLPDAEAQSCTGKSFGVC